MQSTAEYPFPLLAGDNLVSDNGNAYHLSERVWVQGFRHKPSPLRRGYQ
jgi:hypothetical protein